MKKEIYMNKTKLCCNNFNNYYNKNCSCNKCMSCNNGTVGPR